jgi:hypothetical protein
MESVLSDSELLTILIWDGLTEHPGSNDLKKTICCGACLHVVANFTDHILVYPIPGCHESQPRSSFRETLAAQDAKRLGRSPYCIHGFGFLLTAC